MAIIYPVLAMVLLTIAAIFILGARRFAAVRDKKIDPAFFRAYRDIDEPEPLRIASRHVINLFETPILFYVAAIFIFVTNQTSSLLVGLAWMYVAARYLHSYVHLTSNKVLIRFRLFLLSLILLTAMWLLFAVQLLASPDMG